MRRLRVAWILASSASVLVVPALHAQIAQGIWGLDLAGTLPKRAYTATWTEKSVRDSTLFEEFTVRYARDLSGRVYAKIHKTTPKGVDGSLEFVYDPVAHTFSSLNSNTRQAIVLHYTDVAPSELVGRPLGAGWLEVGGGMPSEAGWLEVEGKFGVKRDDFGPIKPEDLGTKTIAGITAQGRRIALTEVIRGRPIGNEQPLTITIEAWRSDEYGVMLQKSYNSSHYVASTGLDIRGYQDTLDVTDFRPGNPDVALFRVPDGYTVKDMDVPAEGNAAGVVQNRPYRGTWIAKSVTGAWHAVTVAPPTKLWPGGFDLASGNPATSTSESTTPETLIYARDSSGRVYEELPAPGLAKYCVFDPVARTRTEWNSITKKAIVSHARAGALPEWWNPERDLHAQAVQPQVYVQVKDLGTKTIAGVTAHGARITKGKDPPLTSTEETWSSTNCGIILQRISDRPLYNVKTREVRDVHKTLEVKDFLPGEPDAALFHVPDGYTVIDVDVQ